MNCRVKMLLVIQFCWMTFAISANGQEKDSIKSTSEFTFSDSLSIEQLDSIFSYSDSLSIFSMIDSLLKSQSTIADLGSSLVIRAGVNSNIISAGRSIGVN
jgi:hypothetical protein